MSAIGHTTPNNGHTNNTRMRTTNGTDLARTSRNRRVMCGSSSPSSVEVAGNTPRGLGDSQHTNCAHRRKIVRMHEKSDTRNTRNVGNLGKRGTS